MPTKKPTTSFSIVSEVSLSLASQSDALPLPESTYSNVYVQAECATIGERARKGWVITEENLGDGHKSLVGGHVNMGHGSELFGHIIAAAVENGVILANLAISRKLLLAKGMDPERLPLDFKVSLEWTYNGLESPVHRGEEIVTFEEAIASGWIEYKESIPGVQEPVVVDANASIYCVGIDMHDIALVDLKVFSPAFPSAKIVAATAIDFADDAALTWDNSIEGWSSKVQTAVRERFEDKDSWLYIRATFSNAVVFDKEGKLYKVALETTDEGTILLGDATEVLMEYVAIGEDGVNLKSILETASYIPKTLAEVKALVKQHSPPSRKNKASVEIPPGFPQALSAYGDPTNFRFLLTTKEKVTSSIARLSAVASEYTSDELCYVSRRIIHACATFGVEVTPESLLAQYAGLRKALSSVLKGGEQLHMENVTMTTEEFENALAAARTEAATEAVAKATAPDSDIRKGIVEEFTKDTLPGLLDEARASEREKIETANAALSQLSAIHPLTQDERDAHLAAIAAGTFDLRYEAAARELAKLKGDFAGEEAAATTGESASAAVAPGASGLSVADAAAVTSEGDGDGAAADAEENPEIMQLF